MVSIKYKIQVPFDDRVDEIKCECKFSADPVLIGFRKPKPIEKTDVYFVCVYKALLCKLTWQGIIERDTVTDRKKLEAYLKPILRKEIENRTSKAEFN